MSVAAGRGRRRERGGGAARAGGAPSTMSSRVAASMASKTTARELTTSVKQRSACTLGTDATGIARRTVRISLSEKTTFSPPAAAPRAAAGAGLSPAARLSSHEISRPSDEILRMRMLAAPLRECLISRKPPLSMPTNSRRKVFSLSIPCTSCCCRWNSMSIAWSYVALTPSSGCGGSWSRYVSARCARNKERERRRRARVGFSWAPRGAGRRFRARARRRRRTSSSDSSAPPSDPMSRWNASLTWIHEPASGGAAARALESSADDFLRP